MNYKIRVKNESESKEVQELFFELGGSWGNGRAVVANTESDCLFLTNSVCITHMPFVGNYFYEHEATELTIPELKDMVVLKRNDPKDSTHYRGDGKEYFQTHDKERYYHFQDGEWVLSTWMNYQLLPQLKPITKEPIMKEFLAKDESGSYFLFNSEYPKASEWIEVPDGADTLAGDSSTRYFWKHGVGEKGNMIIGVGESLTRYSGWTGCEDSADVWLGCVNDDSFKIIWQRETQSEELPFIDDEPKYDPEDIGIARGCDLDELAKEYKLRDRCDGETDEEYRYMLKHCIDLENYIAKETLNDKVASAEVARQSGVFVGAPFDDLHEFKFEVGNVVDAEFFPDNVNQPSHYCSHPSGIECIEITRHHDFTIGNAIKYLWRAGLKDSDDEIQDLEKASWYIQDKINQLKKLNGNP